MDAVPENAVTGTRKSRVVLLAQGSADPRWQKPFLTLKDKLARELGESRIVLAYLAGTTPSLIGIAQQAVEEDVANLMILPLFLSVGDQEEQAIPRQVVAIKEKFPGLGVILLPPIGEHPTVMEAIYTVARGAAAL